jgi:hypothetical protein
LPRDRPDDAEWHLATPKNGGSSRNNHCGAPLTFKKESPMANEPEKREPDIPPKQPDIQPPKQPDIQPEPRPEEIPQDKDVPQKENPPMQL